MIRRVVFVAVRKHQSHIGRELLGVVILPAVHLPLKIIEEENRYKTKAVVEENKVMVSASFTGFHEILVLNWKLMSIIHHK